MKIFKLINLLPMLLADNLRIDFEAVGELSLRNGLVTESLVSSEVETFEDEDASFI